MLDIVKKYTQPLDMYLGLLLLLGIVYVGKIPDWATYQANTLAGRLLLFGLTLAISELYSWPYAVLMATFSVLLLSVAPRTVLRKGAPKDAFADFSNASDSDVKLVSQKNRWWSEKVLDENPIGIEEEKVRTQPIQDASNPSNSTTSSTGGR